MSDFYEPTKQTSDHITIEDEQPKSKRKQRTIWIILLLALLLLLTSGGTFVYLRFFATNDNSNDGSQTNSDDDSDTPPTKTKTYRTSCTINKTTGAIVCYGINDAAFDIICSLAPITGEFVCTDGNGSELSPDITCNLTTNGIVICQDKDGNMIVPPPVFCSYNENTATCIEGDNHHIDTITCIEGSDNSSDNICRDEDGNHTDREGNRPDDASDTNQDSDNNSPNHTNNESDPDPNDNKDQKRLYVSVSKNPESGNASEVKVTLTTNLPTQTPSGWITITDQKFTKTYTANTSEYVMLESKTDVSNRAGVTIKIDNIDSKVVAELSPRISRSPSAPTNGPVTVTIEDANGINITISGWDCSGNRCTKTYSEGGIFPVAITGGNGKSTTVNVDVSNIDKTPPSLTSVNSGRCSSGRFSIQTNKAISGLPAGWRNDGNNIYSVACIIDDVIGGVFTDMAGNSITKTWTISGVAE